MKKLNRSRKYIKPSQYKSFSMDTDSNNVQLKTLLIVQLIQFVSLTFKEEKQKLMLTHKPKTSVTLNCKSFFLLAFKEFDFLIPS